MKWFQSSEHCSFMTPPQAHSWCGNWPLILFKKCIGGSSKKLRIALSCHPTVPPFWACSQKKWKQRTEYTVTRPCSQQYPNSQKWKSVPIYGCCSVAQSCPALRDPMNWSTPGFPVLHYLREFAQTHVHLVGDTIQISHPLWSASPPALSLSQHQGLYHWVGSLYWVAKVLELQLHISPSNEYSGLISLRIDWLNSLQSKGLSGVCSNTEAQKHQFFSVQLSL